MVIFTHSPTLGIIGVGKTIMTKKSGGMRGGQLHRELVDWFRFDFCPSLREIFPWIDWYFVFDNSMTALLLGTQGKAIKPKGGKRGGYYPDGLIIYEDDETEEMGSFVIEIGRYEPDRAPRSDITVLHLGFSGRVSLINPPIDCDIPYAVADMLWQLARNCEIEGWEIERWPKYYGLWPGLL